MNKLLFVDDEIDILDSYKNIFVQRKAEIDQDFDDLFGDSVESKQVSIAQDYEILTAEQGLSAVEIVQEHLKTNSPIKVAFIDMRMPPGINGKETIKKIRDIDDKIEIVVVTAFSDDDIEDVVKYVGRPDKILYLKKPFNSMEIKQLAHNLTEKYNNHRIKDKFLSSVSHELATPITSIYGFSTLLLDHDLDDEVKMYIEHINNSSEILKNIISDLLDSVFFRDGEYQLDPKQTNVNDVMKFLKSSFERKTRKKKLDYNVELLDDDVRTSIDLPKINRALMMLIDNSIKFTTKGSVNIKCQTTDNEVLLSVIDTGIGIEEKHHESIFEKFYRIEATHHSNYGLGLGLYLAKKIIELHQGSIRVKSNLDEGCEMQITLPILQL